MTGLQTLAARAALGGVAGVGGLLLSASSLGKDLSDRAFRKLLLGLFLSTRLLIFGVVFLVLRVAPRGDIPAYYLPEASAALHGALPYRDFQSSYAPLHSFVDGAVLLLWHSPLALILFAILTESLLLLVFLRMGAELAGRQELRVGAFLYLSAALSIQFVAIDGQDNVLVALLVALSLWMALRRKIFLSGLLTALAAVTVKLIPIFYAPVFFAGLRRRWIWAGGFVLAIGLGYGSFAALHLPLLQPLEVEGVLKSAGTLPYLVESLSGLSFPVQLWSGVMLLALGGVYLLVLRTSAGSRVQGVLWGIVAATLSILLFANKSWPPYLMLILFPLCLLVASFGRLERVAFTVFAAVALVEHSFWATLLNEMDARELHRGLLRADPLPLVFLLLEILLLTGYSWLLWRSVGKIFAEIRRDRGARDLPQGAHFEPTP